MASAAARIDDRREHEQRLIDVAGRVFFLEDELQAVGQRLAQAEQLDFVSGMPTRFGPLRSCTQAAIQRSSSTRYAAAVIRPHDQQRDFDQRHDQDASGCQSSNMI